MIEQMKKVYNDFCKIRDENPNYNFSEVLTELLNSPDHEESKQKFEEFGFIKDNKFTLNRENNNEQ